MIAGQKGLVEESDLLIPNMRGIMTARTKPLTVIDCQGTDNKSTSLNFENHPLNKPVK